MLAKIAHEYELLNKAASRADRLMDEYEGFNKRIEDLEGRRNPEVQDAAVKKWTNSVLTGAGIGGGLGAAIGAKVMPKGIKPLGSALAGVTGAGIGAGPGSIVGEIRAEKHRAANEDPTLLDDLDYAYDERENAYDQLHRHYEVQQQILDDIKQDQALKRRHF